MRSAPIPPTVFTTCHCGDLISAKIPPEDRTCPNDRGTVSIDILPDTTALLDALGVHPLAPWQQHMVATALAHHAGGQLVIQYPRRSGRSRTLNAIEEAQGASDV